MFKNTQSVALIQSAADLAVKAHAGVSRKQSNVLYVSHPIAVMLILASNGVTDSVTLAAALLHDVVEDTDWTANDIVEKLQADGVDAQSAAQVVAMVEELSETKLGPDGNKLPWLERKTTHLIHLLKCSDTALLVKLADCIHNAQTTLLAKELNPNTESLFAGNKDQQRWYRLAVADLPSTRKHNDTADNLATQLVYIQRCLDQ